MTVRVRLGAGLARLSAAPFLTVEIPEGATVDDLFARLRETEPDLAPALRSVLPVVAGEHVTRDQPLADRAEVALLLPVSGGCSGVADGRTLRHVLRPSGGAPDHL